MSELRYDGKVAVVTGSGNGIGKQYAMLLASRGCSVVVNDLGGSMNGDSSGSAKDRPADLVVAEIKAAGGEATANYDSVEFGDKIIQTAIDAYGRIDILINNAGILRDVSFHKMTDKDWDLIYTGKYILLTNSFITSFKKPFSQLKLMLNFFSKASNKNIIH